MKWLSNLFKSEKSEKQKIDDNDSTIIILNSLNHLSVTGQGNTKKGFEKQLNDMCGLGIVKQGSILMSLIRFNGGADIKYHSESPDDKVMQLIKGGFEQVHGMSFNEFIDRYHLICEKHPEKLI